MGIDPPCALHKENKAFLEIMLLCLDEGRICSIFDEHRVEQVC